jgi:hypothetical protein
VIALAGKQCAGFQFTNVSFRAAKLAVEVVQQTIPLGGIGFFVSERDVRLDVAREQIELGVGGELVLGALAVAQDGLRGFLIVPEIGLCDFSFQRFQQFLVVGNVKDSSALKLCEVAKLRNDAEGLQESWLYFAKFMVGIETEGRRKIPQRR